MWYIFKSTENSNKMLRETEKLQLAWTFWHHFVIVPDLIFLETLAGPSDTQQYANSLYPLFKLWLMITSLKKTVFFLEFFMVRDALWNYSYFLKHFIWSINIVKIFKLGQPILSEAYLNNRSLTMWSKIVSY